MASGSVEYGTPAEEYTIEVEEAAAHGSIKIEDPDESPKHCDQHEDTDTLESKLQEIVKQSQLDDSEQYIEVYREEDGEKISTITIDGTVVTESNDGSLIHADQIVGYDLMNFKVINCEDDVAQEIITDDGDVEIHDETQFLVQQTHDTNDDGSLSEYDSKHMRKAETQYLHVVERDSIPLVFFSNGPTIPRTPPQESRKLLQKRKKSGSLVPEVLFDSSKFKLFLYNCKQCDFKCNAIKDLTAHRLKEHTTSGSSGRYRNISRSNTPSAVVGQPITEKPAAGIIFGVNMSYCSICSYSSISSQQVKRHILKAHSSSKGSSSQNLDENEEQREEKLPRYGKSHDRESSQNSSKIYHCEDCGFGSNNANKYQKHDCKMNAHSSR